MRKNILRYEKFSQRPTPSTSRRTLSSFALDAEVSADVEVDQSLVEPPMSRRDEAVCLLHAAAEVEHALMVQYLFAAYSLRIDTGSPEKQATVSRWRDAVLQIAREEMGHLATVQNLLLVLGASLNFEREHSPYASELYPFRFKLQPLTLRTLAKYVTAERPTDRPEGITDENWALTTGEIQENAIRDNDGFELNQVGGIFHRLRDLLRTMPLEDFRVDTGSLQAKYSEWGYDPEDETLGEPLIVRSMGSSDPQDIREAAVSAIEAIALQGEGADLPDSSMGTESHFERFLSLYKEFKAEAAGATWPLPNCPNTSIDLGATKKGDMRAAVENAFVEQGRITHARSRLWAQLFNLRYRRLLNCLSHYLQTSQALFSAESLTLGDRTSRGYLLVWTFDEMRRLKKIAEKLVQLPLTDDPTNPLHAGPPFELPYTLNLPSPETSRWRSHRDVLEACRSITARIRLLPEDASDPFLKQLEELDARAFEVASSIANEQPLPPQPEGFLKTVRILEEAVRGFTIRGPHGNFWRGRTVDQIVDAPLPGIGIVINRSQHTSNPAASPLIRMISKTSGWMPSKRPRIAQEQIDAIKKWVSEGSPDSAPGGQTVSAEGEPLKEPTQPIPGPDLPETVKYETHIKVLFREFDRSSMLFLFDLWRFEDVRDNADAIFGAVESGGMPCDSAWPQDKINLLRKWILGGKLP